MADRDDEDGISDSEVPVEETDLTDLHEALAANNPQVLAALAGDSEVFTRINQGLRTVIQSLEQNPSYLSQAARYWGEIPLWQKILGGVILNLPTLLLGIIAHVGFLLTVCAITTTLYTGGGLLLDDHQRSSINITTSLTEGVLALSGILEAIITSLHGIFEDLSGEVDRFSSENTGLKINNSSFQDKLKILQEQISKATETTQALQKTQQELADAATTIEAQTALQTGLQEQLAATADKYEQSQAELAEKVAALDQAREDFQFQINTLEAQNSTLRTTSQTLLDSIGKALTPEQVTVFFSELKQFIKDNCTDGGLHKNLETATLRIAELTHQVHSLEQCNHRYAELLERQAAQVQRLEQIPSPAAPNPLQTQSFFANSGSLSSNAELQQQEGAGYAV